MKGVLKDLTNQQFGKWLVLNRDTERQTAQAYWNCKCLGCNTIHSVRGSALTSGKSTQCSSCARLKKGKNEVGKFYGKLEVIQQQPSKNNRIMWLCKCKCGNYIEVSGTDLRLHSVQSCGKCPDKTSNGEYVIEQLLIQNNISFAREYSFSDFKYDNGHKPRFDFAIFKNNSLYYLIEFDGKQHFSYQLSGDSWNNKENYEKTILRDNIKNQYCFMNGIPLIRIPYTHLKEIKIEDLILERSNYVI